VQGGTLVDVHRGQTDRAAGCLQLAAEPGEHVAQSPQGRPLIAQALFEAPGLTDEGADDIRVPKLFDEEPIELGGASGGVTGLRGAGFPSASQVFEAHVGFRRSALVAANVVLAPLYACVFFRLTGTRPVRQVQAGG
jgi:hypothetical protein